MGIAASVTPESTGFESRISPITWAGIAVIVGLAATLYSAIIADLAVEWWTVDASSYGMLVPPITFYIIYLRRRVLLAIPASPDLRGLWLTAFACVVLLGGRLSAEF